MTQTYDPNLAAATALRLLGPDPQNWVPDRPGIDHNVVVVGGGQTGTALAFALRRAGIGKVSVIGRRGPGGHLAYRRADEPAAHTQESGRAGTGHSRSKLPGLV
ncbi:MAG: hypothetical protein P4L90_01610 [Rhodopila sp.]|nr:hypothetical protein [Rhodopila sp.]